MKYVTSLVLTLSLFSCSAQPAYTDDGATIYGPGARYCKDIIVPDEVHIKSFPYVYFWVQGYISAVNYQVFKATGKGFDPIPSSFDSQEQVKFLFNYCNENPGKDASDAADAIVQKLQAIQALRGDN